MKQILEYTLHYPNPIHYPREEMLFRRLLERDPASNGLAGDLTKDHEELARSREHMEIEEHKVFPSLMTMFRDEDWEDFDSLATGGMIPCSERQSKATTSGCTSGS